MGSAWSTRPTTAPGGLPATDKRLSGTPTVGLGLPLSQAARLARRLRGEKMAWATPLGALVEAMIARVRGQAAVDRLLAEAATGFEAADMRLYAAAARWRRGQLLGGAVGAALCAQADAVLREQGIVRPERAVAMFAPGVVPAPSQLAAGEEAGPRW